MRSKAAIYLEKILPHDPVRILPNLRINDRGHNYLKINEMPFRYSKKEALSDLALRLSQEFLTSMIYLNLKGVPPTLPFI